LDKISTSKPTAFAFSLVQYVSGIKLSDQFLKTLKTAFPDILLMVDGTQFCGTAPFNFEDSAIDVLISSGYKWMLGGYGNGFVFIKTQQKATSTTSVKQTAYQQSPFCRVKIIC